MRLFSKVFFSSLLLPCLANQSASADGFRFDGPHIFETHLRANDLFTGDLNGDGKLDFGSVENNDGLLRLYLSNEKDAELFTDKYTKKEILLEETISTAKVIDTNGDDLDDIIMIGSERELKIITQSESGELNPAKETNLEGSFFHLLDLNQDDLIDLALEDDKTLHVYLQSRDGFEMEDPFTTIFLSERVYGHPRQADVNHDGLDDLIYDSSNSTGRLYVILQDEDHRYRREIISQVSSFHDYEFIRGDKDTLVQIHNPTRRLNFVELSMNESSGDQMFQTPEVINFDPNHESISSSYIASDIDGDGDHDFISGIQDQANLRIIFNEGGDLKEEIIPALKNIEKIRPVMIDDEKHYFIYSEEESLLGWTYWNENTERLEFPQPFALPFTPVTFEVLPDGDTDQILLAVTDEQSKESSIHLLPASKKLNLTDESKVIEIPEKHSLSSLKVIDLNLDDQLDVICFYEYKNPQVYMASNNGATFELLQDNTILDGLLDDIDPDQLNAFHLQDIKTNLLVQSEYARAFALDENGLNINYQITGPDVNLDYSNGLTGSFIGKDQTSLVLKNDDTKQLEFFSYNDNQDRFEFEFKTDKYGSLSSTDNLFAEDLNGDGIDEIVILNSSNVSIFRQNSMEILTKTVATYETDTEDGGFGVVFLPDEEGKGDIIPVLEMQEFSLEFLSLDDSVLDIDYRFKVFSREYQYRRRNPLEENPEPRGLAWGDFNGDDQNDIILLAHDKILVYLYEEVDESEAVSMSE